MLMRCPICGEELELKKKSNKYYCDNCEELFKPEEICETSEGAVKPEDLNSKYKDRDKSEGLTASLPDFINTLPTPAAIPLADYWKENNTYIKLHRLCDAAEVITRFLAIILLSDIKRQMGDFPVELKLTLCENLSRPTFGQWAGMVRKAGEVIKKNGLTNFVDQLNDFLYISWEPLLTGEQPSKQGIIDLRNSIVHSGRITNQEAAKLLDMHQPAFEAAAEKMRFFADYFLVATRKEMGPFTLRGYLPDSINQPLDHHLYTPMLKQLKNCTEQVHLIKVSGEDEGLNLFPLHSYNKIMVLSPDRDYKEPDKHAPLLYFRYNQRQGRFEFTSLEEEFSFSHAGADFAPFFFEVFDIKNWQEQLEKSYKKKESDPNTWPEPDWQYRFNDIIHELAPGLEGRDQELERIKGWLNDETKSGKILWISGKPGMGKSALIAKLYEDIRPECGKAGICLIPFFFRAGDGRCSTEYFYQAASYYLAKAYKIEPEKGLKDLQKGRFERLINRIMQGPARDNYPQLIFLVDGLDELAGEHTHLLDLPLTLMLPNSRWLLSGRNEPQLYNKYVGAHKTETLWPNGELPALTSESIRTIISIELPADKYDLYQRDQEAPGGVYKNIFVEELIRKSEGLPIYLQLIIEDIRNGKKWIKNMDELPDKLTGYYDNILKRLNSSDVSMHVHDILGILSWSREPLTQQDLIGILRKLDKWTRIDIWEASFNKALETGTIIFKISMNSWEESGWTLYHQSLREHLRTSDDTISIRNRGLERLLDWMRGWEKEVLADSAYYYAIKYLPLHLIEYYSIDLEPTEARALLRELTFLITNDNFINQKAVKAGLFYQIIEDFSESLKLFLSALATSPGQQELQELVLRLLEYDFLSIEQIDSRELLQEIWFEYASEIVAHFCQNNNTIGKDLLTCLFRRREPTLNLTRLSLRAAEINGDYRFLIEALEYESSEASGGSLQESFSPEAAEDFTGVSRWVVDALFMVARQDITAGSWERFEGLINSLIVSLEFTLMVGENKWFSALKIALQRKKITIHLKSVFEVVYKIFINYPQDREVMQRLGKIGSALGGIIYGMPAKELVKIPGLLSLIYSMVSIKWNSVAENSKKAKSIEEIFTVSSGKQVKVIEDFNKLILLADYENRNAEEVFPALLELAFCSGLVSSSDEMYQVNRAIHGNVLYHMCKYFPDKFINQYIRKYFLNEASGAKGLIENFIEPISQYCPGKSFEENLEGSRGLYEMLVRLLTYEAVSTDYPTELLSLNQTLIRYIIDHDLDLFCQDYNMVGRPLHILSAVTIAEARVEHDGLPPSVRIIKELAAGKLAPGASEAQRWEAISKCYFDLFYAGIYQVEHVLNCFESLVDLTKVSQTQAGPDQMNIEPTREEITGLFLVSDIFDPATIEAMQKAAGRFAMVVLALKTVNRSKVQEYIKRNDIPEIVWHKMRKWSVFMEKRYPAPSKKVVSIEQMVEKYYEQLAIGLFTNIMLTENQAVRLMLAGVFNNLLEVNRRRNKQGGPKKDDLLGLLRGIMEEVFEILKNTKPAEHN